jgi:hypothetical protein
MTHDPTRDCEHGRLKGKCDVCDLQAEVERLKRVNAELVAVLREAAEALEIASCGGGVNLHLFARDAHAALAKATGETK